MSLSKALGKLAASLALSSAAVGTQVAFAQTWHHASGTSQEGVSLTLDYTTKKDAFNGCYKCTYYTRTDALWLNLQSPVLKAGDSVRAVLVNKRYAFWTRPDVTEIETREVDFAYAGSEGGVARFTVEAGNLRTWGSGYGGTEDFELEVAIVVNGVWLKDPVSGTSNFRFALSEN